MDTTNDAEADGEWRVSASAPPIIDETEGAEIDRRACEPSISISPTSEETEPVVEELQAPPPNRLKTDALRRLKALERRGKTVGTHLDELGALLTILFEIMPD